MTAQGKPNAHSPSITEIIFGPARAECEQLSSYILPQIAYWYICFYMYDLMMKRFFFFRTASFDSQQKIGIL